MINNGDFKIPSNWETYFYSIKERVYDLIRNQIWSGIQIVQIELWLKNFESNEEKYFAACILDSLIYRSNAQTEALVFQLFTKSIPNLTRVYPTPIGKLDNILETLGKTTSPAFRIVAATGEFDGPTASSYFISRLLRRQFSVYESWIINPKEISRYYNDDIKIFIFIDDFLGTGNQFYELGIEIDLTYILRQAYCIYAPLVAHQKGIEFLKEEYPALKIVYGEYLENESAIFNHYFNDDINTPETAKNFYLKLIKSKNFGITDSNRYFGYGNLALAYAFEHGIPDNSLHILWYNMEGWHKLFNR